MDGILKMQYDISECTYFNVYRKALTVHQSFRLSHIKHSDPIVQNIAEKLNKLQQQQEGLILLYCLLEQCSLEVVEQKGNVWTTACIKICNQNDKNSANLAYDVLGVMVIKSCDIPELGKSFSGNFIAKICDSLKDAKPNSFLSALKCLLTCLRIYPGPCGISRNGIEKFLIKNFVDCVDMNHVKWSGKCFHQLQQVRGGGGGIQGNQKLSWKTYQMKLVGSLHSILDLLFINCPEFYDSETEKECLTLGDLNLSNDPVARSAQLATRFKNLANYLIIAMRDPFPATKGIQPKKILNLISRGLSITCDTLERNAILDNIAIGAVLPDIHVVLYKLLGTLILTLKNHLNIFHEHILGLFTDSLKWTSSGKSKGFKKPYSELRVVIYTTLSIWCQTMKFGSCVELAFDQIFKEIDSDITPFRNEITLQVSSESRKHMSKKDRRQLHKSQNEKSHLGQTHMKNFSSKDTKTIYNDEENRNICYASLTTLKDIYSYCSCFLKPLVIKELQEKIIKICLTLNETKTLKSALYSNSSCRRKIYDVLSSLVIASHHLSPPPISLIIQLLGDGQTNDYSSKVRDHCADRLQFLEKILHPQKKCLYFPPELISIKAALRIREFSSDSETEVQFQEGNKNELDKGGKHNSVTQNNESTNDDIAQENVVLIVENNLHVLEANDEIEIPNFLEKEYNDISGTLSTNSEEHFANSMDNVPVLSQKSISCPKKRLLHNLQKCSEDEESDTTENIEKSSPKRIRRESEILEVEERIVDNENDDKKKSSKISPLGQAIQENENLFEEILATFTDELNDE